MLKQQVFIPLATIAVISLSACQTTGGPADVTFIPITTLAAFEGGVVGKTLVYSENKSNTVVIAEERKWDGEKIGGEWVWEDSAFCRTINGGKRDCQQIEMSSKFDRVRVTRNRGNGDSWAYLLSQ